MTRVAVCRVRARFLRRPAVGHADFHDRITDRRPGGFERTPLVLSLAGIYDRHPTCRALMLPPSMGQMHFTGHSLHPWARPTTSDQSLSGLAGTVGNTPHCVQVVAATRFERSCYAPATHRDGTVSGLPSQLVSSQPFVLAFFCAATLVSSGMYTLGGGLNDPHT